MLPLAGQCEGLSFSNGLGMQPVLSKCWVDGSLSWSTEHLQRASVDHGLICPWKYLNEAVSRGVERRLAAWALALLVSSFVALVSCPNHFHPFSSSAKCGNSNSSYLTESLGVHEILLVRPWGLACVKVSFQLRTPLIHPHTSRSCLTWISMGLGPPFLREIIPFALGDWARTGQYINGVLYHGNLNGCHKVFGGKKRTCCIFWRWPWYIFI